MGGLVVGKACFFQVLALGGHRHTIYTVPYYLTLMGETPRLQNVTSNYPKSNFLLEPLQIEPDFDSAVQSASTIKLNPANDGLGVSPTNAS